MHANFLVYGSSTCFSDVCVFCRDIRENYIRAKYELKAWIPRSPSSPPEVLGKQLCEAVKTSNVMTSLELIIRGANVSLCSTCVCVCVCVVSSSSSVLFICMHTAYTQ